jgi:hypothetical protein
MNTIYFDSLHEALVAKVFSRVRFSERKCPKQLYHYTTVNGFQGVLADNKFRATSADSSSDQKEIAYGCELFAKLIETRTGSRAVSTFTRRVLNELESLPKRRVGRVFLASFCERDDCLTLWKGYGGCCLCFANNPQRRSSFLQAPVALAAGLGFTTEMVPAIYDKSEQDAALGSILDLLIETLEDRSLIAGFETGPWISATSRFVAFTISNLALRLIVCLKSPVFADEREWRVVATPSHLPFSSDPDEADRNCECHIKSNWLKRYVELAAAEPEEQLIPGVAFGLPTPPLKLPIDAVRIGPCNDGNGMAELARQLLDKSGFEVSIVRSEIPTLLDCH